MGRKYILVSHIQGSRVEEKINFGEKFTPVSRLIIQFCEKYSFKHAYKVCFPSNGAYEYFCNSPWKIIRREEFTKGNTLYNTLYAFPKSEQYLGVEKANDTLTFLSVGQLTIAKGMDKHPLLFEKILEKTNKKIRYIMVGKGKLEKEILKNLEGLKIKYDNFDYMYIEKCSYPQMQYLQDISDVYLMLHRISIFDLTTLEVMKKGKCIILSDVGGNPEFNKENNIILCDNYEQCANDFINCNLDKLSIKNKEVYNQYFSQEQFKINYLIIMKDLLNSEMQYNVE
jgi:glycosyltransferase involved in cell wall biosynthesis